MSATIPHPFTPAAYHQQLCYSGSGSAKYGGWRLERTATRPTGRPQRKGHTEASPRSSDNDIRWKRIGFLLCLGSAGIGAFVAWEIAKSLYYLVTR